MPGGSSSGLRAKLLERMARVMKAQDRLLEEYVERVKRLYPDAKIYLIGSRARGTHLPYSDYDILIILPNIDDKLEKTVELRRLKPRGLNLDLIVVDNEEAKDPIIKKMLENAKQL